MRKLFRRRAPDRAPGAAQAFLRLAEDQAAVDVTQVTPARRAAALSLAVLFLVAVPLLWVTNAQGGDGQQATLPAKSSGSNSGPGGGDDDDEGGDGDDSTADDMTTSGATANTVGTTNTGGTNTTAGPEDTDTGATNTTAGDNGTTDSTGTTDAAGMTDTGTTSGDLVMAAKSKVRAGAPIKVRANCSSNCDVSVRAFVKGPGPDGKVRVKTRKVVESVGADGEKLKLKLRREARREVKDAAKDGEFRKRAKVIVKAKADTSSGKQSERLKLKLKK